MWVGLNKLEWGAEIVSLNDPLLLCSGRGKGADGIAYLGKEQQGAFLQYLSQKSLLSVACLSAFTAFNQNQRTLLMPQTHQSLLHLLLHSASFWSGF